MELNLPAIPNRPDQVAAQDPVLRARDAFLVRHRGRTRAEYQRALRVWGAWCAEGGLPILAATRSHVELWLREMEERGLAASTRALRLAAVSGYYEAAVDEELVARNPAGRVKRPKLGRESQRLGLDRDEGRRLLEAGHQAGPRDYALTCLLLLDGLRISEALGARPSDLSTEQGHRVLYVQRKGGYRARVALPPQAATAVDELLAARRPIASSAPLFVDGSGAPMDVWDAGRVIRRLARAAGVSKTISPHSLRHTFVTSALAAGVPLHIVQDGAGHADPRTTRRYDRARHQLDGHAAYSVATYLAR